MTGLEERLRLILAIIEKDLRVAVWVWVTAVVIGGAGFLLLLPAAMSAASYSFQPRWIWYDFTLRPIYAVYAALTSVLLAITFASFHGGEVRRGTIRSIILYPVDMNDITIAKLVSSLVVTAILSTILFVGVFGGFFLFGVYPASDFLAIHAVALAMSFLALSVGVFLANALARVAGRMVISPSALGALFLLFAILFTETALSAIGTQIASLFAQTRRVSLTPDDYRAIQAIAQALSVLSPHHVGARVLGILFEITGIWSDLHIVAPVAAIVLAGGYVLTRKLYLDLFIR